MQVDCIYCTRDCNLCNQPGLAFPANERMYNDDSAETGPSPEQRLKALIERH